MANNQIALMAQTPVFDTPYESQGKALQLRQLMNQSQAQDMDMAQKRQAMEDDRQTRDVYSRTSDPAQRIAELYRVNPKAAMALQTFQQGADKSTADIGKTKADTNKIQRDTAMKQYEAFGQAIGSLKQVPGGATPQHVTAAVQRMVDMGVIDASAAQKLVADVPQNPADIAGWLEQGQASVMSAKDQLAQTSPDANARLAADTKLKATQLTVDATKRGQNLADSRAKEVQNNVNKLNGKPPAGYAWGPVGEDGMPTMIAVKGGPADVKSNAIAQQKALGASDVDSAVATLRDAYGRLEQGGGITSTANNALGNMAASASSSGFGQAVGKALGTNNQSARNDIAMTRPALLAALMKATGMSAKQMDSNAELKLWLATATDPALDVESNRRALTAIERKYLSGQTNTGDAGGSWDGKSPVRLNAATADAEFAKLPSGAEFISPDGKTRRKP